jgi:uncharacterized protein
MSPTAPPDPDPKPAGGKNRPDTDPRMLETLVCPITKTRLIYNAEDAELISVAARLAYPIRQGIPLLILDEARPLTEEELARLAR